MRSFLSTHWKSIVALIILVLIAIATMKGGAAHPDLAARLQEHVRAVDKPGCAAPHIEQALAADGYRVRREAYQVDGRWIRKIEATISGVPAHAKAARVFIVGTHFDSAPDDNGSGTAAVLELARLLKNLQPAQGTELRFVFFMPGAPPWLTHARQHAIRKSAARDASRARGPHGGNFIAFAGTLASSELVRQALAAFRATADVPSEGLASPAYVEGVTLSDQHDGEPSLMITDTAFQRYPYFHTGAEDKPDYESMARVIAGLARTITALAGGART
jgi:hypothetical protein